LHEQYIELTLLKEAQDCSFYLEIYLDLFSIALWLSLIGVKPGHPTCRVSSPAQ